MVQAGPKAACGYARTMLLLASVVVVASLVEPPRAPGALEVRPAIVVDGPEESMQALGPDPNPASPQGVWGVGGGWLLVLWPVLLAVALVLLTAWSMRGGPSEADRRAALSSVRERLAQRGHKKKKKGHTEEEEEERGRVWRATLPLHPPACLSPASAWSVCGPLTTVEALYEWAPPCLPVVGPIDHDEGPGDGPTAASSTKCLPHHPAIIAYLPPPANVVHEQTRRGRLVVCHDFNGGYHPYETQCYPSLPSQSQGAQYSDGAYRLPQWAMVDAFIYFAHSLVSLPPPQWVNSAHRHGAKAMGTFITEWDDGHDKCKVMFKDRHSAERVAVQLAKLAVYHRLEGWLINIENKIDWTGGVDAILHFLSTLTSLLRSQVGPQSVVLWYDSVTADTGELLWQNGLTGRNEAFLTVCDGLFVNYVWDLDKLASTAALAKRQSQSGRRWDVYMGIDVFGRGTYGGGGWQCRVALEAIRNAGLSAALFAPGWVWEKQVAPYFNNNTTTPQQEEDQGPSPSTSPQAEEEEDQGKGAEAAQEEEEEEGDSKPKPQPESECGDVVSKEKEKESYVGWAQVEAAFAHKHTHFWARLAQVWPAKPWPPCLSLSRPLLTNFSCGAGTRLYGPHGPWTLTHDNNNKNKTDTQPWVLLGLMDMLPLPLTLCPPSSSSSSSSSMDLRLCHTHAYRGPSCLLVSACLPSPSLRLSSPPLFSLCPQPALMQALEVHIAYKLPHNTQQHEQEEGEEDDLYVEVVLSGPPSTPLNPSATSATTVLVLRGHPTSQHQHKGSGSGGNCRGSGSGSGSGGGWESRRVGSVREGDTQLLFYAPTTQYTDTPLPLPSPPPNPLPTAAQTLQLLEGAVASAVQGGGGAHPRHSSSEASSAQPLLSGDALYEEDDKLHSIPWTHRVWRVRDLALLGRTLHHVRLCCLKKKKKKTPSSVCPTSKYFRAYVGELLLAHVPTAYRSSAASPVTSLLPSLKCSALTLTPMMANTTKGVTGLVQWEWALGDSDSDIDTVAGEGMPSPSPSPSPSQSQGLKQRPLSAEEGVRHVDVLLLPPSQETQETQEGQGQGQRAVWLGRSLTCSFMVQLSEQVSLQRGEVVLSLQPTDLWGNTLPLPLCPTLVLNTPSPSEASVTTTQEEDS